MIPKATQDTQVSIKLPKQSIRFGMKVNSLEITTFEAGGEYYIIINLNKTMT